MNDLEARYMSDAMYIVSKIDNNSYCKSNGQFTKHLRKNGLTYQQYYELYISKCSPTCSCGKSLTFYQKTETYANSCGNPKCVGKNVSNAKQSWSQEQRQQDSKNKRIAAANKTVEQMQAQVERSKQTFQERYGVDWATQSESYKPKSKTTKHARYGNAYFNGNKKTSLTWQSKTAHEVSAIVDKRRTTCLERFGVENALMKPAARANSAKSNSNGRDFTLPSGRVVGVRGYEDVVIAALLETYAEEDLVLDDRKTSYALPIFEYIDHRRHHMKYYPDIYIPKENKIIEVKSCWWWDGNSSDRYQSRLQNNLRKKDAVLNAGYNYQVWLFAGKTEHKVLQWTR